MGTGRVGVILLSLIGPISDLPRGWVEAKSKDGRVTFAMPIKPTERTVEQKVAKKDIKVLEYSCTAGKCLYRLEKSPVPIEMPEEKLAGALKASRDAIAKKNKILEDRETTLAGWPARELVIEAPLKPGADPSKVAMLLFYADNEFYQVRVFALEPGRDPKDAPRVFRFRQTQDREAGQIVKTMSFDG